MKGFIRNQMDGMAEESYAVFQKKLVFTSLPVEGIRIPRLRALVSAAGEDERRAFMDGCEFSSFEEVLVYGFCAGKIREKEKLKKEIDFLLPHFDNWAHVDCVTASLSAIKRDRDFFLGVQRSCGRRGRVLQAFSCRNAYGFLSRRKIRFRCGRYICRDKTGPVLYRHGDCLGTVRNAG